MKKTKIAKLVIPVFHVDEDLSLEEQIARRVDELWQERGFGQWNDIGAWFQAKREVKEWHRQRLQRN
jgi:hypothetical protein